MIYKFAEISSFTFCVKTHLKKIKTALRSTYDVGGFKVKNGESQTKMLL